MRFNSVFAAFCFIVLTSALAMVLFVQTKSFGKFASKVITDVSERRAGVKIKVKDLKISLFPPGAELNRVTFEKKLEDGNVEAQLGKIGVYLNLFEIEERRLVFGEINISDSVIEVTKPESKEPLTEIDQKVINNAFDTFDHLPVRINTIILENTKISLNHDLLDIKRFKVFKQDNGLVARFHVANINPDPKLNFILDEIWGDLKINRHNINIQRLKIQHDVQSVVVKGKVENYRLLKNAKASISGESHLYLKNIKDLYTLSNGVVINDGVSELRFDIHYAKSKLSGEIFTITKDLDSSVLDAEKLEIGLAVQNDEILLSSFSYLKGNESAQLAAPTVVADFKRKNYLPESARITLSNVTFENALQYFGKSLESLKGNVSGTLDIFYRSGDLEIGLEDGFTAKGLGFATKSKLEIVTLKLAKFNKTKVSVVNKSIDINTEINLSHSKFQLSGSIHKGLINLNVDRGQIDLEDFGNIANLGVKGAGPLSIEIIGPGNDLDLNFQGQMSGFEVLGYKLGKADIDLGIGLGASTVTIKKFDSIYGATNLTGNGVVNYGNADIALGINTTATNFHDLSGILTPVLGKIKTLPADLDFAAGVDAYIFGKTRAGQIKIKSDVRFTDLVAYGEVLNEGHFTIGLAKDTFSLENFEASKSKGTIQGKFAMVLPTGAFDADFIWENLQPSNFNGPKKAGLNFDGRFSGRARGGGAAKNFLVSVDGRLFDTRAANYKLDDSLLNLKIKPEKISGTLDIFGDMVTSDFEFMLDQSRRSTLNVDLNLPDIKPFAVALFGQHVENETVTGRLFFNLNSSFDSKLEHLDLKATLRQLAFQHESFVVNYKADRPQFLIENSDIKKWDLKIDDGDLTVNTSGAGKFHKNAQLSHNLEFNAKILQIFLSPVLSADGFINANVKVSNKNDRYDFGLTSSAKDLGLSIEGAPFPLDKINYQLSFQDKRLIIKEMSAAFDAGNAALKGDVYFDNEEPDINIRFNLERAEVPIFTKSVLNMTGEGIIIGNNRPYNLGGEIFLNKVQIVNELSDFNKKTGFGQVRFLPRNPFSEKCLTSI